VAQGAGLLPPKGKAGRACRGQAAAAAGSPAADEAIETKSTVSTPAAASEGRKAGNKGRAARKAPETAAASGAPAREQQDKDAQEHEHEQEQQHAGAVKQGRAQKQVLELEEGSAGRTRGGRAKASPAAVVEQGRRSSEGKRSSESLPEDSRKRSSSEADLNAACGSMKAKAGRNAKTRPAQPVPKAAAASRSSPRRPSADSDVSGPLGSEDSAESPGTPSRLDGSTSGGRLLGTRRIAAAKEREEGGAEGDGKADAPSRSVLGKRPSPSNEGKAPKSARTSAQATQQRREVSAKAGASSRPKPAQMSPPSGCARVISGTRVATKSKFVLVCGKTAERAEQQAAVQQLGGQSAHIHGYMEHATHILVKELRRTEKFLCACAAGRWILKPAYIVSCKLNNQWLQEQSYEWNNPRKVDKDQKDLWHGAPRRWRQYWVRQHGTRARARSCALLS
jgi:hypothetical protein